MRKKPLKGWARLAPALAATFALGASYPTPSPEPGPAPVPAVAPRAVKSPILFGTTFSHHQLRSMGLDWRKALDASDGLGLRYLRVGAYWSDIERTEGHYDFAELDELLSRMQSKGYAALVTVGMKAPRWPEFYIPGWAAPKTYNDKNAEVSKDPELRRRVLSFVTATARHLSASRTVVAWQVENEPMDRSGAQRWFIGEDFLAQEVAAVRRNGGGRPIVINAWCDDQLSSSAPWSDSTYAVRNALALGDVLGLDVYPRVGVEQSNYRRRTIDLPTRYIAWTRGKGKEAWIVESQAEPWPPSGYDAGAMDWLVDRHREQGYKVVFLWGFESWYQQHLKGDDSMWKAVSWLGQHPAG